MFIFYFWKARDRSDLTTIKFNSYHELSEKLTELKWSVHDAGFLENEIRVAKNKTFHAFPSRVKGVLALEWYTNQNLARSAYNELGSYLARTRR